MIRLLYLLIALSCCVFPSNAEGRTVGKKSRAYWVALKKFIDGVQALDPADEKWSWMDEQIEKDFANIDTILESTLYDDLKILEGTPVKCYRIKDGNVEGPTDNIAALLKAIHKRYSLPDLVLLYYYDPIAREDFFMQHPISTPLFCSAKGVNCDGKVIHFTDMRYRFFRLDMGLNKIQREIDRNDTKFPWEEKLPVMPWRDFAEDTTGLVSFDTELNSFPRGKLVQMSLEHPLHLDARFIKDLNLPKHFPQDRRISIPKFLGYKYQIALDGETASFPGFQWKLYSGCLNFKQDSPDTMWYYGPLKPYVHYIPVSRNLEDLLEKINWAIDNDEKAQEIAENAKNFAKENLKPEHMLLYDYKVLLKYASLFKK